MKAEAGEGLEVGRSHIIKRPRLTRLLDETTARIILLVAPAGYGKTTLAREWLASRTHSWYRGNSATGDVAALALGLARTTARLMPGADERLETRLRVSSQTGGDIEALAQLLADGLAHWPPDAWLAFDDYHFACDSEPAERLVEELVALAPARLLIASRSRPAWASARQLLYGEIYELGRTMLAMSQEEAQETLLIHGEPPDLDGLIALADGWPALLGVVGLAAEKLEVPNKQLPNELYSYFAEEVYGGLAPGVQQGLRRLSLTQAVPPELAMRVAGGEVHEILNEGLRTGFFLLTSRGELEFHPLLRSFLQSKFDKHLDDAEGQLLPALIRTLILWERWDDAFDLIERFYDANLLVELFEAALLCLVDEARLGTLDSWIKYASQHRLDSPILDLAEAEVSFKHGDLRRAEALGIQAARRMTDDSPFASRAFWIAGMAAHLASREQQASYCFAEAAQLARSDFDSRQALWGRFTAAYKLDRVQEASALLEEVENASGRTADELLRITTGRLMLSSLIGGVLSTLSDNELIVPLGSRSDDPLIHSSFLNVLAATLNLAGRYEDARISAEREIQVASTYGLEFVLPNARLHLAASLWGLRDFQRCAANLRACEKASLPTRDVFLLLNIGVLRARTHLVMGKPREALSVLEHYSQHSSIKAMHAEYLAWWSLAHAIVGQSRDATHLAQRAETMSGRVEVAALVPWVRTVVASKARRSEASDLSHEAMQVTLLTGNVDAFVTAYRACPELLGLLGRDAKVHDELRKLLEQVPDHKLAALHGLQLPVGSTSDKPSLLTVREHEVVGLVSHGLTNKEIARALFITEATVKVHVRKICRKLGVRSRTEAAMRAAELSD